jgi:selenide,water dikinase
LRDLPRIAHPDLLVGPDHFEDAGVYRLSPSTAIVQTVDFFPPLVDDPFTFGQIAAANALSDLYAMGATPLTALNLVAFPDKDLPAEILSEILRGGADRVQAAGAVILGGHSLRDTEIKYGLACTGIIHPDRIVANNTAKPGDVLVLTKPIGSGVLTSAAKQDVISEDDLAEAIEVMTALNDAACKAMLEAGVSAATDVTGFGLLGHAFEMAEGANVTLEIEAGAVPLLQRTYDLASKGVLTRAHKATLEYLGKHLKIDGPDVVLVSILADAQTSGGLLISLPEPAAQKLLAAPCGPAGRQPSRIGRVCARSDQAIIVRA